jgi:hypothetical protein
LDNSLLISSLTRRVAVLVTLCSLAVLPVVSAPAKADLMWAGMCTLDLTIAFSGASPTVLGTSPGYTITVNNPPSTCLVVPQRLSMTVDGGGSAGVAGNGTSNSKCGILEGSGTWQEHFSEVDGIAGATHHLGGTWLDATMIVYYGSDPTRFAGAVHLVPADINEMKAQLDLCTANRPLTAPLHMIGYQVWQDPDLSSVSP